MKLSDAESVNFHCVPNQVLYQAEPLPDVEKRKLQRVPEKTRTEIIAFTCFELIGSMGGVSQNKLTQYRLGTPKFKAAV